LNIYGKIAKVKCELQARDIKKTGKSKFTYFELSDFLPTLNVLLMKNGLCDNFSINSVVTPEGNILVAQLKIFDTEEMGECALFSIPFTDYATPEHYQKDSRGMILRDKDGEPVTAKSMQDIQNLGALNTYYKRYLYLNAFGICEGEVFDALVVCEPEAKPEKAGKTEVPADEPNYKVLLNDFVKANSLVKKDIAKEFGLTLTSSQEEYAKVLEALKKKEQ
jgi:hypothetical protein